MLGLGEFADSENSLPKTPENQVLFAGQKKQVFPSENIQCF
jgi:hypothetical protein